MGPALACGPVAWSRVNVSHSSPAFPAGSAVSYHANALQLSWEQQWLAHSSKLKPWAVPRLVVRAVASLVEHGSVATRFPPAPAVVLGKVLMVDVQCADALKLSTLSITPPPPGKPGSA